MKTGSRSDARLAQVAELDELRRRKGSDPQVREKLVGLCRVGMLEPYWERGEKRRRRPIAPSPYGSGSRLRLIEGQLAKATSPTERRQFDLRREQLEREEESGAKQTSRKAAA